MLREQLDGWLTRAASAASFTAAREGPEVRAVIAPHAGYSYSGATAAFAYLSLQACGPAVRRVFVLGPSHHFHTPRCALSACRNYRTPLGDLPVDQGVYGELFASGLFETMSPEDDEAEHSLELQLPYIRHVLGSRAGLTVVPIVVGALAPEAEEEFGRLLAPYLRSEENAVVVSSDFCHWGARFRYTFWDRSRGDIDESVEWLDREGMGIIERGDPEEFRAYLDDYRNTICGRHPIAVLLHMLRHCGTRHRTEFVRYAQSSRCKHPRDSSVSYASAVVTKS